MPNFMISILKGNFTWCFTKGNPHNMLPETNMICSWKWTVKGKLLSFPFRRIGKHSARWVGTYPRPELSKKLEKGFLESFGICFGGFLEYVPGAYTLKVPTAKATKKRWERKTILPFWLRQIFRCEMINFKGWGLCWRFLQVSFSYLPHQPVQKLRASLHCRIKRWLSKQEGGRHIQASLRKEARARKNWPLALGGILLIWISSIDMCFNIYSLSLYIYISIFIFIYTYRALFE